MVWCGVVNKIYDHSWRMGAPGDGPGILSQIHIRVILLTCALSIGAWRGIGRVDVDSVQGLGVLAIDSIGRAARASAISYFTEVSVDISDL